MIIKQMNEKVYVKGIGNGIMFARTGSISFVKVGNHATWFFNSNIVRCL